MAEEVLRDQIRILSGEELGQVLIQLKMTTLGNAGSCPASVYQKTVEWMRSTDIIPCVPHATHSYALDLDEPLLHRFRLRQGGEMRRTAERCVIAKTVKIKGRTRSSAETTRRLGAFLCVEEPSDSSLRTVG